MQPLISVIIPAYNAERYIQETIISVINQTYQAWELIIIDDGSTDATYKVIEEFLTDKRIKYMLKPNSGVSDSRNFGAGVSKADYLCFLDADDIFLPNNLEEKIAEIIASPETGLVYADVQLIDENSKLTGKYFYGHQDTTLDKLLLWDNFNIPGPSSALVNKGLFDRLGGWDKNLSTAADQDLFFRIAAISHIKYVNKVLTSYRVLPNSMSRDIQVMEKDHIEVYKKAIKTRLFKSYNFKQRCLSNLYYTLGASWWHNGGNKLKGTFFLLRSVFSYPPSLNKILKKITTK